MAKDEADIIGATIAHMLGQVDAVILADNISSDGTADIARQAAADIGGDQRLFVLPDPDPRYRQSEKMTGLALRAHQHYEAEWIVPFDADEIWYSPFGRVADQLNSLAPKWDAAGAVMWDHVPTALDDPDDPNPVTRIRWHRSTPGSLPKVAVRWATNLVIEQGNHSARYGPRHLRPADLLQIRHFPYRSPDHMVRKVRNGAAAYNADPTIPEEMGIHWRQYGQHLETGGEATVHEIFHTWFYSADPEAAGLILDPALDSVPDAILPPPPVEGDGGQSLSG